MFYHFSEGVFVFYMLLFSTTFSHLLATLSVSTSYSHRRYSVNIQLHILSKTHAQHLICTTYQSCQYNFSHMSLNDFPLASRFIWKFIARCVWEEGSKKLFSNRLLISTSTLYSRNTQPVIRTEILENS